MGASGAAWWIAGRDGSARPMGLRFVCPMHPEATADTPGECPICHMALEPSKGTPRESAEEVSPAGLTASKAHELVSYARFAHFESVRKDVSSREIYAPGWLESDRVVVAQLYKDEVAALEPEERAWFFLAKAPGVGFDARASSEPPVPWDRSTSRVHFRLEASSADAAQIRSREPGWIKLASRPRSTLLVPSAAVLESSDGPYVLTGFIADRRLARRPIEIGKSSSGFTSVVAGVREREPVAMDGFFIDAEWRLRAGAELGAEVMP